MPSITRVWPALCPPWKRTTTSARADSQSTILPLPSSPHWAPITATFDIVPYPDCCCREAESPRGTVADYRRKRGLASGGFGAERQQHRYAAAVGIIALWAQLLAQEAFFQPRFHPIGDDQQEGTKDGMHSPGHDGCRNGRRQNARVNGMSHDCVRPCVHNAVAFFPRD